MKPSTPELVRTRRKFTVFWDRETLEAASYLVNKCTYAECQWFHFVDRTIDQTTGNISYYIHGIIIPEQVVTGATVESDGKAMLKIAMELREKHGLSVRNDKNELVAPTDANGERIPPADEDVENFNADCQRLAIWCHSHVKMACHPSGTDNEQWKDWIGQKITEENPSQPVMMFIFNQQGEYFSRLYDPVLGAEVENATFHILDAFSLSYIDDLLKTRIKQKTYTSSSSTTGGYVNSGTGYTPSKNGGSSSSGNLTTPQTSTTPNGGSTTAAEQTNDLKFKIAWTGATYDETLKCGRIIASPIPMESELLQQTIENLVEVNEQWFGDDSAYCWYIADTLLFDNDRLNLKDLYSPTDAFVNSPVVLNSLSRFKEHCTRQDTYGAELFPAAMEIAFGYCLQSHYSTPQMIQALTSEWLALENRLSNRYHALKAESKKNKKNTKGNNVNSSNR